MSSSIRKQKGIFIFTGSAKVSGMRELVHYYFAYGSNMNPERVKKRQMDFHSARGGRLRHYQLAFNKRSVKYPGAASANVVPIPGAITEGVAYRLAAPEQIEMMDPFEGYPHRYNRLPLRIHLEGGDVDAWVYVANHEYVTEGLNPARWYLEHLLAGREFLSRNYYEALSGTPCLPDSEEEP
jgi:cation transport regulator ChaC